jgi:outer membrane protein assembly factor BamB
MRAQLYGALVLAVTVTALLRAEDWPEFRGPTGQGVTTEAGLPTEWGEDAGIAWSVPIPGLGWSSPIVVDDRVFVTTATDEGRALRLLCLDRDIGHVLWNEEVVQQETGGALKRQPNSYATPTPVTDGSYVYVLAFDGSIAAVTTDGSVAWVNRDFHYYSEHGIAVSLRLYGDLLIVPFDTSSTGEDPKVGWQKPWDESFVLALDSKTGKVRWKGDRGMSRIGHVTPNLARERDREVLVSGAGDVVEGFDLKTGERLWNVYSQGEGVVPSIVVGDGLVYATSGFEDPTIRAIRPGGRGDVTETHIVWEQKKGVPMLPSFVYAAPDHLFTITEGGIAQCLDARTGEILGRRRIGGKHSASPVYSPGDKRIYFLSEDCETTVVEAIPQMPVVGTSTLPGHCQASLAASGGHLFLRTDTTLYSIGPRP